MESEFLLETTDHASGDNAIAIECPKCGADIFCTPDAPDLYCRQCKMIVMQLPLNSSKSV